MFFSANTGVALIDSRNNSGIIQLPSASEIIGRIIYIKDKFNTFNVNPLTLQGRFENNQTQLVLNEAGSFTTLVSDGQQWNVVSATQLAQTTTQLATISSLSVINSASFGDTINAPFTQTTVVTAVSTIEFNSQYSVGPGTPFYRGDQLFTPLNLNMAVYDLPISTSFADVKYNVGVNTLSTFTAHSEFNIPIDFGVYKYQRNIYSTLTQNLPLNLTTRNMTVKLWGAGGNCGTNESPIDPTHKGGDGSFIVLKGFYPRRTYGFWNDITTYTIDVPSADTAYLGVACNVVSSITAATSYLIGRGAIYGASLKLKEYNVTILGAASGGAGLYLCNAGTVGGPPTVTISPGQNALQTFNSGTDLSLQWNSGVSQIPNHYGIGGGGATIGSCNLNSGGGGGTNLCNIATAGNPFDSSYRNGVISVYSAGSAQSINDQDYIDASGGTQKYGQGAVGTYRPIAYGTGLGGNPMAVITQPYDALTSNLTLYGNGSFTSKVTADVVFSLSGPDGLYLSINDSPIINDWTTHGTMRTLQASFHAIQSKTYNITMASYNANTSGNAVQLQYYIPNIYTTGDHVKMQISSGVFFNDAKLCVFSSIQSPNIFTSTMNITDYLYTNNGIMSTVGASTLTLFGTTPQFIKMNGSTMTIGADSVLTVQNANSLYIGSTIIGLGSFGYISTPTAITASIFQSSLTGLGTIGYISTSQLTSTIGGLATAGYISTSQLTSTLEGLGTAGYISTSQLTSTLGGLGTAGYISTSQLTSTLRGLGTAGYISTSQLTSSLSGLGSLGFISTIQIPSTISSGTASISILGSSTIRFFTNSIERMTITSTGLISIQQSTPRVTVDISGSVNVTSTLYVKNLVINKTVNTSVMSALDVSGNVTINSLFARNQGVFGGSVTAATFATPSDRVLKKDIENIENALSLVGKTQGVQFKWKESDKMDYGFIAQEIDTILPQAIVLQENNSMYINYTTFIPFITESIKDLSQQIATLQIEVSTLKNK
jgi:hypothetical protein